MRCILKYFSWYAKAAAFKYGDVEEMYDIISPLRVLLAKEEDANIFFDMESHLEDRKRDGGWVESHKFITDNFKNKLGFKDLEKASEAYLHLKHRCAIRIAQSILGLDNIRSVRHQRFQRADFAAQHGHGSGKWSN